MDGQILKISDMTEKKFPLLLWNVNPTWKSIKLSALWLQPLTKRYIWLQGAGGHRNVTVNLLPLHPARRGRLLATLAQRRRPRQSRGPCCCPRWASSGSSRRRFPTPDRCRWTGRSRRIGRSWWAGQRAWAAGGCWSWSPRCSPEGCWPGPGCGWGPRLWGSSDKRLLLSGGRRPPTPAPVPVGQFSNGEVREALD